MSKLRSLAVPRRREEKDQQQQQQQQDQRRSRSSSSSPTTRISTLVLSIATCWLVFTALVVFRNAPETHRLVDGIAATEKHLLDEVVGRYDSIANHHHPLAVALKHAADAKGVDVDVGVDVGVDGPPKPEVALEPPRPEEIVPREAERPRDGDGKRQQQQLLAANHDNAVHPVAGLDCADHGGPADPADAKEMVYWRDVPEDNAFVSPFSSREEERRYLTFEPDGGGWNNIRMSMETVLALAVATGRVLVLPPSQRMYLLGQTTFNFADFFPLQELAEEHAGLEIISTERFLLETMGKVRDSVSSEVSYPPGRKTRWDGDTMGIKTQLGPWLRSVSLMPDCAPDECIFGVPSSADPADAAELARTFQEILMEDGGALVAEDAYKRFVGEPIPVDAPTRDRLTEFLAGRSRMLVYDAKHQTAPVLHFHGKSTKVRRKKQQQQQRRNDTPSDPGGRLLVHFYAFLFFQDWRSDTWTKRFVRDHLRYVDHVQCAAARVVHALRTTHGGTYDSFHIRRGDFQYKKTRVEATEIVAAARDVIPEGRVVYVGTDERDKSFFKPLIEEAGWNVFFLDDFLEEIVGTGIDKHYYGMIDQLVVSRGDHFFGCWFSTFTGYIMRLRGYHTPSAIAAASGEDPDLAEALAEGALPRSYFYALKDSRTKMHEYWPIKKAFYAREFPTAWRKIDAT